MIKYVAYIASPPFFFPFFSKWKLFWIKEIIKHTNVIYFEGICKVVNETFIPPAVNINEIRRRISESEKEVAFFCAWVCKKYQINLN